MSPFASIEQAIRDVQDGKIVIIVDDEDRENEGDLMVAAEKVTPEIINFMATHGRGLICLAMTGHRLDELNIPLMVAEHTNTSPHGTAFCVSIEARRGVSTGISAFDRAQTGQGDFRSHRAAVAGLLATRFERRTLRSAALAPRQSRDRGQAEGEHDERGGLGDGLQRRLEG